MREVRWISFVVFLIVTIGVMAGGAYADPPVIDCTNCHLCEQPTPSARCLRTCTRSSHSQVNGSLPRDQVPDVVLLDELEDRYLPVPFDHRGHADMAEMTQGCVVCHHYTPEGADHPACKTCHEVAPARADMRKPGLKGAYHRQCMNCHREWSHETACSICHLAKTGRGKRADEPVVVTKDDIVGRMHPPIPEPDQALYQTSHLKKEGTNVLFRHKDHIHRYGIACAQCHRENSCGRCHEEGRTEARAERTLEDHHRPCSNCHDVMDQTGCGACHWDPEKGIPPPFSHDRTGWSLGERHAKVACRACHKDIPFARLDRRCDGCHSQWNSESFDHARTGQSLNEAHREFSCEDCHPDRAFASPPVCSECHEEDEGISFPDKRPGLVIEPKAGHSDSP